MEDCTKSQTFESLPGRAGGSPIGLSGHYEIHNHQLRALAPSIFAGQAHARVSDRYSFLPTSEVVDGLRAEGWAPVWAGEQRIRLSDRKGFQKHMLRLARVDDLHRTQAEWPELVLVNSHDRSSSTRAPSGLCAATG